MVNYQELARPFKGEFDNETIEALTEAFKRFDLDGNGSIDSKELATVVKNLGETIPEAELKQQIAEVDIDRSGTVEFNEFLQIVKNLKKGRSSAFGKHIVKSGVDINKITSATGATHAFSEEEKESFTEHINSVLKGDPICDARLPINPQNMDLFSRVQDGVLLCKLVNDAVPDTIDARVLNTKLGMNKFEQTENLNLLINSAKAIGCSVVNVGAADIMEGREHLILGLIWQIVRIGLLSRITLTNHPELFRLLEPGEDISDLLKLSPDQILIRWVNYHLKRSGASKRINNFSKDIADSEAYTYLLNQLSPDQCDKSALSLSDNTERAKKVLGNADKLGCKKFVQPRDIVKGNPKLNLAFVANLFNTHPGLEPLTEEEKAALDEFLFASEGTREARAFCLWINSLGIDPFVNNLFEDLRDGLVILRVMDIVSPGVVDWRKVNSKHPLNKFKKVENCNYAVVLGKQLKFSLVGVGGPDLVDGNQTLTLALVWQLMRFHVLSILKGLSSKTGKQGDINEDDMVKWANSRVAAAGKSVKMDSFRDSSLKNSHFFLELLNTIRKCVNYELVTPGQTDEDATQNAKYAISIARKLGCCIFLLPEDIVEVKPKMILTLVGSIMSVGLSQS